MDVLTFLKERKRMCEHYLKKNCHGCPRDDKPCGLGCRFDYKFYQEYIDDVVKWREEHPRKTRLQDFKEKYPNAYMCESGLPSACCMSLGYCKSCDDTENDCEVCWNMPVVGDE